MSGVVAGRIAILVDIDGTLVNTGGAGAASWRLAFDELYGIPADIASPSARSSLGCSSDASTEGLPL